MQQKIKIFQKNNYIIANENPDMIDIPEAKDNPMHPAFTKQKLLWFDAHEFQSQYLIKSNDFIGKNPIIAKEPNPMAPLDGDDFKQALIMYKVYNELSFDYETEFEAMLKKTLDCYTSQDRAERMVDYIHSLASDFHFKQENYKKCREMKDFVAKRLAKQNWNDVAVDLIENVKICSLKMNDYESFVQSEFELINVKKEDVEIKKERMQRIISKFEESNQMSSQIFTMNNPLIRIYARFDCKRAEIFDSVGLSIRIDSLIDFSFNKIQLNFNEKTFNKEIDSDEGQEIHLSPDSTYQKDLTIFVKSQIQSDLTLDFIVLEKKSDNKTLSLIIHPLPDINIDNLIFGSDKDDSERMNEKVSDDPNQSLKLKISETRQKVDMNIAYKQRIFLGELVPIDFTLKCKQGCEIIDSSIIITDVTKDIGVIDGKDSNPRDTTTSTIRKSTSIALKGDFDDAESPFELAESIMNLQQPLQVEVHY
jgi:hypothetical protein